MFQVQSTQNRRQFTRIGTMRLKKSLVLQTHGSKTWQSYQLYRWAWFWFHSGILHEIWRMKISGSGYQPGKVHFSVSKSYLLVQMKRHHIVCFSFEIFLLLKVSIRLEVISAWLCCRICSGTRIYLYDIQYGHIFDIVLYQFVLDVNGNHRWHCPRPPKYERTL